MDLSLPCTSFQFLQFPGKGRVDHFWRIYSYIQRLNSATQHTSTVTKKMSGNLLQMQRTPRTVAWQQPKEGLHIFQALPSFLRPTTGLQSGATLLKEPMKVTVLPQQQQDPKVPGMLQAQLWWPMMSWMSCHEQKRPTVMCPSTR